MISVVMSVYNEKISELDKAVNSILDQTYRDFEFIIVIDNPSNERLILFLEQLADMDNRIIILKNEVNIGLANSLNKAIKYASYEYIARMDADDISFCNRLERELSFFDEDVDVVFSKYKFIDEEGQVLKESLNMPTSSEKIEKILPYRNIISHPTVMMRKSKFLSFGGYSTLPVVEDLELWLRMIKGGAKFKGINETLLLYRVRDNSMTNQNYFRSHTASKLIKKHYRRNHHPEKITNEMFLLFYQKRLKRVGNYNSYAKEYYHLVQTWGKNSKVYQCLSLARILICEPRLIDLVLKTMISNRLRS